MIGRSLSALGVLWLAGTLAFFALRALPGDAITAQLIDSKASLAQVEARRAALGLDQPLVSQYGRWLAGALSGDLGVSLQDGQPVSAILLRQLPPTLSLALSAWLIAVSVGIGLGVAAGFKSRLARLMVSLALSAPIYWTGTLAIWVFAVLLDWLPSSGDSGVAGLILPACVLGLHGAGGIARVIAASVCETLHADFVTTARGKGLTNALILRRHILRASLLPAVSVIGLQAGFLFSGTVITETLFIRPGIGRTLLDAVIRQDYPVVQGIVLWIAAAYLLINAAADAASHQLDPRIAA